MRKFLIVLFLIANLFLQVCAKENAYLFKLNVFNNPEKEIKNFLTTQVKYANKMDFDKFISTYDNDYVNADGFDLETYSSLIKDVWKSYENLKYGIQVKNITIDNDYAVAELKEFSSAIIPTGTSLTGLLKSEANSIYYLKKIDGSWKVTSDSVINEITTMMYGEARAMKIDLSCPEQIVGDKEYTASLSFIPPSDVIAIASIANDLVEYPQKPTKEVFRKMPEDNVLERIFKSNDKNVNEYIVGSIGLTRPSLENSNIKLSLVGFGYTIKRVNVIPQNNLIDKSAINTEASANEQEK